MKVEVETLSDLDTRRIVEAVAAVIPRVAPSGWAPGEVYANGAWWLHCAGLRVMVEVELNDRDQPGGPAELWLHASLSRRDRVPSYADLTLVKDVWLGRNRKAVMVLPSDKEHYNYHPHCLHLYAPLDRDPLPDFRLPSGAL